MKKKYTNKDFQKFNKRNTHKRRDKERRRAELLRAIESSGVAYSENLKIRDVRDNGGYGSRIRGGALKEVCGIFSGTKSGFGFVSPEEGYDRDIFIPEDKTLGAIDGDYVRIAYKTFKSFDGEEKTEGRVEKIEKYGRETVIGTLCVIPTHVKGRRLIPSAVTVIPDDPRITIAPAVVDLGGAQEGDKVMVKLIRGGRGQLRCAVVSVFGNTYTKEANYGAILADCGIVTEFSAEELRKTKDQAGRRQYSDKA